MSVRIRSYHREFIGATKENARRGLMRGAITLQALYKQALNRPNTGERKKRTRNTSRGKKGSQYTVYPHPSKPGEPPRKITGTGQQNIFWRMMSGETVRVGVSRNGIHLFYLEIGTRTIARRPWMLNTLQANKPEIVRQIMGGMKGEG